MRLFENRRLRSLPFNLANYRMILINVFMGLLVNSSAKSQNISQEKFLISGTFNAVDSGMVKLFSTNKKKVIDSAIIKKGKFFLRGNIGQPEQRLFQITPGIWAFMGFIEQGDIIMKIDTANAQHFGKMGRAGYALIWNIEEKGSQLSDAYDKYKRGTKHKYYDSLFKSLSALLDMSKDNDTKRNIATKIDSIGSVAETLQRFWIEKYIDRNPSSSASAFILADYFRQTHSLSLDYLQSMLEKLSGNAKQSIYYTQLVEAAQNMINRKKGATAPDFTLLAKDKTTFKLSSLKGEFVLLDFWASWCGPCRQAIPHWKGVYKKYHHKGLEIVSISGDRNWNSWTKALDKEQMPWQQVIDEFPQETTSARVGGLYGVNLLPYYILLNKEGKIVLATLSEDSITAEIKQIIP